jgi:hypothetical protein
VDQDYDLYSYRIPETRFIDVTRRYQKLSAGDQRRFLFYPGSSSKWGVFSLDRMNTLLEEFTLEKLACSPSYDYTLYASGLKNFTPVTAGDSRPIAAANLLYQNVSVDVIRQLLVHVSPKTCFHYYSNVADTVLASSIIAAQRELNKRRQYFDQEVKQTAMEIFTEGRTGCRSSRRPLETGDIADCEKYGHLEDCFGCPLYLPAEEELSLMLDKRREELNSVTRTLFGYLAGMSGMKRIDADKTLLEAQTGLARFMEACQQEQKEGIKKWQRHNPTQTSCC